MNWNFLAAERLWWLLAVVALAAAYVAMQFRRTTYATRFSNLALIDSVAPRSTGWKRHVIAVGYLLALCALIVAVAQPTAEERVAKERVTIILAIDTSLSMEATDVTPNRIVAAKAAADEFVEKLPKNLQVGLVSFSGSTSLLVPPTVDHQDVRRAIDGLELDQGTAIGDAVKTSLQAIDAVPADESGKRAPAVIVLLSDGKTTAGTATEDAVEPARTAGVPVWTIAYGTPDGYVDVDVDGSGQTSRINVPVDTEALAALAEGTGGTAFEAASSADLSAVYDKLGSRIGYDIETREVTWKALAAGLVLLAAVSTLSLAWFQRLP